MRTNPFYYVWLFLLGQTSEHQNIGVDPLLTLLFLVLLIGSAWIAWRNWKNDPAQRTGRHLAIWLMRVMVGSMWFQAVEACATGVRRIQRVDPGAW
jgi:predicted branched-subunit amino acid permease